MKSLKKYKELEDQELLSRIRESGDIEIKSVLFERYMQKVFGLCLKYLKNEEDARDAVMSIYELFLKKIETHKVENINGWIYTVSKNYCLDLLRKKKRQDLKKESYKAVQSESFFHPYSEDILEEQLLKLTDCISELKKDQKMVIDLFYQQKKSYAEICEELSLSWSKIRSLIQNARRNLKNCMEAK